MRLIAEITARVYTDLPPAMRPAAERNVLAHLIDLHERKAPSAATPALTATGRFPEALT
jgi:hypothetical protein